MRYAAVLLIIASAGCAHHVEYLYAHTITGIVVDADARPVAGARVARVLASGASFGDDALYVTSTDAQGRFKLEYRGVGGERQAGTETWHLVVHDGLGRTVRDEVQAPWSCMGGGARACPGFHADVVLRLR